MKDDRTAQTIATYNRSAEQFAQHFRQYADGVARKEIEKAFELAGSPAKARIVEVGCGAGKDAAAIAGQAAWYEGFDPSERLVDIARSQLPTASFVVADAMSYAFPDNVDIVFAFASMLHVDRDDFAAVCGKIAGALRPGGIVCMTLKEADMYKEVLQEDEFGSRQFYLYNPEVVNELAGASFENVFETHDLVGPKKKRWFTIMLRRVAD